MVPNRDYGPDPYDAESGENFPWLLILSFVVMVLGLVYIFTGPRKPETAKQTLSRAYGECRVTPKNRNRYLFDCPEPEMFNAAVASFLEKNAEHQILGIVAKKR